MASYRDQFLQQLCKVSTTPSTTTTSTISTTRVVPPNPGFVPHAAPNSNGSVPRPAPSQPAYLQCKDRHEAYFTALRAQIVAIHSKIQKAANTGKYFLRLEPYLNQKTLMDFFERQDYCVWEELDGYWVISWEDPNEVN
jgi:hypothetical protein